MIFTLRLSFASQAPIAVSLEKLAYGISVALRLPTVIM